MIESNEALAALTRANPVIPVVVVDRADDAVAVGRALLAGGITTAEVTFRTAAAPEAIAAMSTLDGLTVGAGTVTDPDHVRAAAEAGATYIVSPGFDAEVVRATLDAGLISLPACTDGSWIMAARSFGLDTVKFFPAATSGGLAAITALSAAFPGLRFVPTGGVSAANLGEYLSHDVIAACGGSWMVARTLVSSGSWEEITRLSAQAVAIAKETGR